MLNDFPTNPMINLPGMAAFHFCPHDNVSVYPPIIGGIINQPLEFYPGTRLYAGYCTQGQLEFNEKAGKSDNGTYYQWSIKGFIPGDSPELVSIIQEMETRRFILVVTDNLGERRLVGYQAPLDFSAEFSSGSGAGDARGYRFEFSGNTSRRAPAYRVL